MGDGDSCEYSSTCLCYTSCYGYSGCVTCNYTCYNQVCTCNAAAYGLGSGGCDCNASCYQDGQNYFTGITLIASGGGEMVYYPPAFALSSTDWITYTVEINENPVTSAAWTINGTSGLNSMGYGFPTYSGNLCSAHVSQLYAEWYWWPLRATTTLYLVKNGSIIAQLGPAEWITL